MKTIKNVMILALAIAATMFIGFTASADPLPGQVLKFDQQPLDGLKIDGEEYYGHDEESTIYGRRNITGDNPWSFESDPAFPGVYMADDFADRFDTPVVHVRWWGSYMNQNWTGEGGVRQFLISFEKDVPAITNPDGTTTPSHPDFNNPTNLHQVVVKAPAGAVLPAGSGLFTETLKTPPPPTPPFEALYEYNAELAIPFDQDPDTVYWLKIVALIDPLRDNPPGVNNEIIWGWHNRDYSKMNPLASVAPAVVPGETIIGGITTLDGTVPVWHFQDDAVQGRLNSVNFKDEIGGFGPAFVRQDEQLWQDEHYVPPFDGPSQIIQYSKDLAFQLYTVPEPSSMMLVCIGMLGLVGLVRRKR